MPQVKRTGKVFFDYAWGVIDEGEILAKRRWQKRQDRIKFWDAVAELASQMACKLEEEPNP